jgi:ABC-type glycerol-3-phosphate transport system substrate-binding protein
MIRCHRVLTPLLAAALLLSACSFGAAPDNQEAPIAAVEAPIAAVEALTAEAEASTTSAEAPAAEALPVAPRPPATGERITITFGASEEERALFEPLIEAFEQENPDIHVQFFDLYSLFRQGEPAYIDRVVMNAVDTTLFGVGPRAYQQGLVQDLTLLMEADPSFARDDFYPGALEAASQDGKLYVVPSAINVPLLFYNKALWKLKGLPEPSPDWTWPDLVAAAEQLATKPGDTVEVYGLADRGLMMTLMGELQTAGVDLGASADLPFDDPRVVAAFERAVGLTTSGAVFSDFSPGVQYNNSDDYQNVPAQLIGDQKIGSWDREMNFFVEKLDFPVGVAPMPLRMGSIDIDGYVMSSGTENPQAAWRWLSFLSREALPGSSDSIRTSTIPARKSLAERSGIWQRIDAENAAALNAMLERPTGQQAQAGFPPLMEQLIGIQPTAQAPLIDTILRGAVSGEQTVRDALRSAQQAREAFLAQQPTLDSGPVTVATPVAEAPEGAATLTFGAVGIMLDQAGQAANSFNAGNPEVFVTVKDLNVSAGPTSFAGIAATNDCFAWAGPLPADLATVALDIQPLLDADIHFDLGDYPEWLLLPYRRGNGLHGLPYTVFLRVLHYNKTAFDSAGVTRPSADWGLQEFISAANQLTQGSGAGRRFGIASGGGQTSYVTFFLDRFGASRVAAEGGSIAPNFTDQAVVTALQSYVDTIRNAAPRQRLEGYTRSYFEHDTDLIIAGQAGMWLDHSIYFAGMSEPYVHNFSWAFVAPPLTNGVTPNDLDIQSLHISAQSTQAQACWQWLRYLGEQGPGIPTGFPARISQAESEAFLSQAPAGAAEVYMTYRAALENNPMTSDEWALSEDSSIDYYWFYRAIDQALQGDDLERALSDAQTLTERFLACVQGGVAGSQCALQVDPDYDNVTR